MSELEKIQRYIDESGVSRNTHRRYTIRKDEGMAMGALPCYEAIWLAFTYGRAKGYRAAKAEGRANG